MKKVLLGSILLSGMALFGCSATTDIPNPSVNSGANPNVTTVDQVTINEQQAKEIAIKEAGGGEVVEFSYDSDDYVPNYDITVLNGKAEYEFEISAIDGSILKRSMENELVTTPQANIDESKVREIVTSQINGTIVRINLDQDDHRLVYDVIVVDETYKYDLEVSTVDGTIISQEKELIDKIGSSATLQGVTIDKEKAKEIVLSQVSSGIITEISFDYEDGVSVYEITAYEGSTEYEFEINGVDGSIISRSVDSNLD